MHASVQGVSGLRVRAANGDQEVDHEESDLCNAAVNGSSSRRELRNLQLNRPLLSEKLFLLWKRLYLSKKLDAFRCNLIEPSVANV